MSIVNLPWPVTVWLQRENADDIYISDYPDGTTWCSDKIGDNDIEYIQKSEYDELQRQLAEAQELIADRTSDVKFEYEERIKAESQLAEAQEVGRNLSSTWKSTEDELQRQLEKERKLFDNVNKHCGEVESQLADAQELASQINTDWIPANKKLAEQLAEREAVIANMSQIAEHVIAYLDDNLSYDREADYAIEQLNELRKMSDEIRSK